MQDRLRLPAATLAAALFCATALSGCRSQQPDETGPENAAVEKSSVPRLPVSDPPLSRARLLLAVAQAASSHSMGTLDREAQRKLDGKQFEVRLRFGCDGQGPGRDDHGWSVDPDGRTLRLRAVPTVSLDDELARGAVSENIEAVEGFWLPRPWLLQAACPAAQPTEDAGLGVAELPPDKNDESEPAPTTPPPAVQRIGIARFYTPDDSRTGRRIGRPFEAVKQLEPGEEVGENGFNLVLSGRLRARADGRVILCAGSGQDRPPDCVVSAAIDKVWIENPDDKAVMAEWSR